MGLPTDCPADCGFAAWRWTQRWFGDCVCTSRDAASFTLGLVSVFAWGVAELPQIVTNFRNGTSEGVSFAFVATWLTGDALNLIGCAVSPTLPTQLYTAIVYTSTTVVLIAQHVAYGRRGEAAKRRAEDFAAANEEDANEDASLAARLLEYPVPDEPPLTTTTTTIHGSVDVEATTGVFVPTETNAVWVRPRNVPKRPAARRLSGTQDSARSLSSARTFVSGSWTSNARPPRGIESSVHRVHESSGATNRPDESFTAHRRSRSEQARRRSVGASGSAAAGAIAAALGVATCVALGVACGTGSPCVPRLRGGRSGAMDARDARGGEVGRVGVFSSSFDSSIRPQQSSQSSQSSESSGYAHAPLVPAPAWVGQALGWTMTAIYLGGRVPQILLNRKRGSVEGLSVSMFALAVLGNLTYFSSILARSAAWRRVRPNLPWLCDAALCLAMDAVILWQYARYARGDGFGDSGDSGDDRDDGVCDPERDANDEGDGGGRFVGVGGDPPSGFRIPGESGARARPSPREEPRDGGVRVGYVALSGSEGSEPWETP